MIDKKIIPIEWIRQMIELQDKKIDSIHFDSFKGYKHGNKTGIQLLEYACELLMQAHAICDDHFINKMKIKPFIRFPLPCTDDLEKWSETKWLNLGTDKQPPELVLVAEGTPIFGNIKNESYSCPINLPIEKKEPILALFTSNRDEIWEFWPYIYLYYEGDL